MLTLFDTHCHLVDVLHESGAHVTSPLFIPHNTLCLSVSTQPDEWQENIEITASVDHLHAAIGIHPWRVSEMKAESLQVLETLLSQGQVAAIGEIGLDYYPEFDKDRSSQNFYFESQLELARQYDLPVSIHCRKAFAEILSYLKDISVSGVMHGFSGSYEQACEFTKLGFKIGFGSMLLNPNAKRYHRLAERMDLTHMVLESDAPNGHWQEGSFQISDLIRIAEVISEIKQISVEQVVLQTTQNAKQILRIENA